MGKLCKEERTIIVQFENKNFESKNYNNAPNWEAPNYCLIYKSQKAE